MVLLRPLQTKDYKSIFVPDPLDIVLQRVPRNITKNTKTDIHAKNTSDDIDDQALSLQEYLRLLTQGQTPMLDMLFCPEEKVLITSPEWERVKSYRHSFLHKGTSAFVGHVRQQAAKQISIYHLQHQLLLRIVWSLKSIPMNLRNGLTYLIKLGILY